MSTADARQALSSLFMTLLSSFNIVLSSVLLLRSGTTATSNLPVLVSTAFLLSICTRYFLQWFFGRAIGWTISEAMSTAAIHERLQDPSALLTLPLLCQATATRTHDHGHTTVFATLLALCAIGAWQQPWWTLATLPACLLSALSTRISTKAASRLLGCSSLILAYFASQHRGEAAKLFGPTRHHQGLEATNLSIKVVVMTAPRPGNPPYLVETVESWLSALNSHDRPHSIAADLLVYTHFETHDVFDQAKARFAVDMKRDESGPIVRWLRDPNADNEYNHAKHLARALRAATVDDKDVKATVILSEDDFPVCRSSRDPRLAYVKTLSRLASALRILSPDARVTDTAMCGLFFGTGGSGIAMMHEAARLVATVLDQRLALLARQDAGARLEKPDVFIQDCLRGRLPECAPLCALKRIAGPEQEGWPMRALTRMSDLDYVGGLAVTERMLQFHVGYNTSTSSDRKYGPREFACGWRHPFNGEPDVIVV